METIFTLISVAFGATLTYLFQWSSDSRKHKRELKKEKITIYTRFLKEDILNGPISHSLHFEHFNEETFIKNVYPFMLDNYYYFPVKVRSNLDTVYYLVIDSGYNDRHNNVPDREFYKHIHDLYIQSLRVIKKEMKKLIK